MNCASQEMKLLIFKTPTTWAEENPHETEMKHFPHTFSFNVWCDLLGDNLIGPFLLPERLKGEENLHFSQTNLTELLEEYS